MTAEQQARDLIERMGLDGRFSAAAELSAGDVVELANLIAERDRLKEVLGAVIAAYDTTEEYDAVALDEAMVEVREALK